MELLLKPRDSDIHCSIVYNSQDMETTSMSINRGVDPEDVVHIHNGILLRTDIDSQTLKNLWSPKETVCEVVGCAGVVGWKSYKIGL